MPDELKSTDDEKVETIKLLDRLASFVERMATHLVFDEGEARNIAIAAGKLQRKILQ